MEMRREFAYERFRRDIDSCEDVEQLQKIAKNLLKLYLAQQEAVTSLINQNWLPKQDQ